MIANWWFILTGMGVGLIMSAPAGPVNFLCFHRTLHRGLTAGLMIGFGAVIADAIFASAAIFGLKAVSKFINDNLSLLQVIGGTVIIVFGIYLLLHRPTEASTSKSPRKFWQYLLSGFALTTTNPGNLFGFLAIFSGLTDLITEHTSLFHSLSLIVGVIAGAVLWWVSFTGTVYYFRNKITKNTLLRINKTAGVIILGLGILLIGRYVADLLRVY